MELSVVFTFGGKQSAQELFTRLVTKTRFQQKLSDSESPNRIRRNLRFRPFVPLCAACLSWLVPNG
jgi:hypothetical protein